MYGKIQYGYKYIECLDIYTIRRLDGISLDSHIPINLIKAIMSEEVDRKGKLTFTSNIHNNIYFDFDKKNAIIDFNGRKFSEKQVTDIINMINNKKNTKKEPKRLKKILSILYQKLIMISELPRTVIKQNKKW